MAAIGGEQEAKESTDHPPLGFYVGCLSLCTNEDRCQPRLTGGGGSGKGRVWKYGSMAASALPESARLMGHILIKPTQALQQFAL